MPNYIKYIALLLGLLVSIFILYKLNSQEPTEDTTKFSVGFNDLVWSDEFNNEGVIDSTKWFLQTQLPPHGNWWGGLIQHYTDREENTFVKDGKLYLVARKEKLTDQGYTKEYTSARINSKFAFTYGRVEIKAMLPEGVGTWPAIWMLNTNIDEDGAYWDNLGYGKKKWPDCGEIDILEHWGKNQNYVSSAVHNGSSYGDNVKNLGGQKINDVSNSFHIYTIDWDENSMIFAIDGKVHYAYKPKVKNEKTWPYDDNYYLILNIAIEPDIGNDFVESPMVVDYIRIYQ
ncbi:MAG: glycoside hydrolase family 16 protein [Winogradskyella sp.]|uniref:glycoside hydrolase family 16 protein n=1 Tax=Winogradskyella sp. TaxID=1883156 RepID=UPI0025DFDDA5|nr:glycoside hydrolase family 16 protein [Winogradskyella sp.]NRB84056.1 glycoside hydrolase family 16 protein [Winogradskyella sp.]